MALLSIVEELKPVSFVEFLRLRKKNAQPLAERQPGDKPIVFRTDEGRFSVEVDKDTLDFIVVWHTPGEKPKETPSTLKALLEDYRTELGKWPNDDRIRVRVQYRPIDY